MKINNKGFTLLQMMIVIAMFSIIASIIIPNVYYYMKKEKIAQRSGKLVKEFKQELESDVVVDVTLEDEAKTVIVDEFSIKCINGKKTIVINGKIYHIGIVDTWDDIKSIDCE